MLSARRFPVALVVTGNAKARLADVTFMSCKAWKTVACSVWGTTTSAMTSRVPLALRLTTVPEDAVCTFDAFGPSHSEQALTDAGVLASTARGAGGRMIAESCAFFAEEAW